MCRLQTDLRPIGPILTKIRKLSNFNSLRDWVNPAEIVVILGRWQSFILNFLV